jgi:hypothetical protein
VTQWSTSGRLPEKASGAEDNERVDLRFVQDGHHVVFWRGKYGMVLPHAHIMVADNVNGLPMNLCYMYVRHVWFGEL